MRLHHMQDSGNCYKVRLLAHKLGLPLELVPVDVVGGETRTRDFLRRNPNGKVPLLELPDGSHLPESNAILWYLASGSPLLPADPETQARILQWLFFEQYSHEPYIATVRYWIHLLQDEAGHAAEIAARRPKGEQALAVMEQHLSGRNWFAGKACSIADLALYAYTHLAHEGGFALADYPALLAWLKRVGEQPGHITLHEAG